MTTPEPTDVPRWVTRITWTAVLIPLPYGISRVLWAAGIPVGIDGSFLRELGAPGWGSVYIFVLALLAEGTAMFTHVFVATRRRTVPVGIPFVGGRPVRPRLVIGALLAPIAILAVGNATSAPMILDGFAIPADNVGMPGWSLWGQIAIFWIWGLSLTAATFAYWRATRPRAPMRTLFA